LKDEVISHCPNSPAKQAQHGCLGFYFSTPAVAQQQGQHDHFPKMDTAATNPLALLAEAHT
jgi:hypothetical protein